MIRRFPQRSRAFAALLLFCALFSLPSCDTTLEGDKREPTSREDTSREEAGGASEAEITRAARGETATTARTAMDTAFVHRATGENSRGDYTYLGDPGIDGDPNAVVIATPVSDAGDTYDHNIGVWYEPEAKKWAIFNQDRAPVPPGATFQVIVPGGPAKFVHTTAPENLSEDGTYLDDPLVNGKPEVVLSTTQNWNPGGGKGVYNDHPVGTRYDAGRGRWEIFNKDGAAMPKGASFNVAVSEEVQATGDAAGDQAAGEDEQAGTQEKEAGKASEGNPDAEEAKQPSGDTARAGGDDVEIPKYKDFYSEGNPKTPEKLVSSESSSGAIPVVKPFNFGRDPGGPEDKTMYLTVPKIGLQDVPVFDTVSEEKLRDGTVHIPATGYPWQKGANVYIAGHRLGYENTLSYYVFFRLDELSEGDEILLEDSAGGSYLYRVTTQKVVGPDSVEVMNPVEGKSLVTLQTCTLPDYKDRLIVQGELVERNAKAA